MDGSDVEATGDEVAELLRAAANRLEGLRKIPYDIPQDLSAELLQLVQSIRDLAGEVESLGMALAAVCTDENRL